MGSSMPYPLFASSASMTIPINRAGLSSDTGWSPGRRKSEAPPYLLTAGTKFRRRYNKKEGNMHN